jgi:hypothetical protein
MNNINKRVKALLNSVSDQLVFEALLKQELLESSRPCGDCQECCQTMKIVALDKPPLQRCQHQCLAGCAIYDRRPTECEIYFFHWKYHDELPDNCRPDECGIVMQSEPDCFALY